MAVGHGQTRQAYVVVACLRYSRAGAGAVIFSKQTPDLLPVLVHGTTFARPWAGRRTALDLGWLRLEDREQQQAEIALEELSLLV